MTEFGADARPEKVIIAKDHEEASGIVADLIIEKSRDAALSRGVFHLALAGGGTPKRVYELLADPLYITRVAWSVVNFYWGDERCVPPDDQESNYRLANELLLSKLELNKKQIHRIDGENPDYEEAAQKAAIDLPDSLDVLLMGMGDDGHTLSLFPGQETLHESESLTVVVYGPKPPNPRISLTPPVIEKAKCVIMLATGSNKADAIKRALEGEWNIDETPAQLAKGGIWVLDELAASLLEKNS